MDAGAAPDRHTGVGRGPTQPVMVIAEPGPSSEPGCHGPSALEVERPSEIQGAGGLHGMYGGPIAVRLQEQFVWPAHGEKVAETSETPRWLQDFNQSLQPNVLRT